MQNLVIQLGRFGDIINILPLAQEANRMGRRMTLMVSREFASILEGISYVDTKVWDGPYNELNPAIQAALRINHNMQVSQVWASDYPGTRTRPNFQRQSWARLKQEHRWEQIPLVFDRRDVLRERALAWRTFQNIHSSSKVVLVNLSGHSSPLPMPAEQVFSEIKRRLGETAVVIDISDVRAHRIYDLLGIFDHADCLITTDTATLHLAQASSVPVIALVHNDKWLASARRSNHLLRMPYSKIDYDAIEAAVLSTLYPVEKIAHVYPMYEMHPDDMRRVDMARDSWNEEYQRFPNWDPRPVWNEKELKRTSKTELGDNRVVPFVKDMVDLAFDEDPTRDAVVLTNTDVGFSPGMTKSLERLLACKGALYCYRFDFDKIVRPLTYLETVSGQSYGGLDLFAFTRTWWEANRHAAPDMVMGCTHWDLVYRDLVKRTGGGELYGAIWHELHNSYWKVHKETAGNVHNIRLARKFGEKFDTTNPF